MLEVEEERLQGDVGTDEVEVEVAPEVGPWLGSILKKE